MPPYIVTRMHPWLFRASNPTIRVWIFLVLIASRTTPIVTTAKGIAEMVSKYRPVSRRAVSAALAELSAVGLIKIQKVGNATSITFPQDAPATEKVA